MLRRFALVLLCLILICPVNVQAIERRYATGLPSLDFSDKTATCAFSITNIGKHIEVTMELWCGNTLVDSWRAEGNHSEGMLPHFYE